MPIPIQKRPPQTSLRSLGLYPLVLSRALLLPVHRGMLFRCMVNVLFGMQMMRMRYVSMMRGVLVVTGFVVLRRLVVVMSGLRAMVRGLLVVLCSFL